MNTEQKDHVTRLVILPGALQLQEEELLQWKNTTTQDMTIILAPFPSPKIDTFKYR